MSHWNKAILLLFLCTVHSYAVENWSSSGFNSIRMISLDGGSFHAKMRTDFKESNKVPLLIALPENGWGVRPNGMVYNYAYLKNLMLETKWQLNTLVFFNRYEKYGKIIGGASIHRLRQSIRDTEIYLPYWKYAVQGDLDLSEISYQLRKLKSQQKVLMLAGESLRALNSKYFKLGNITKLILISPPKDLLVMRRGAFKRDFPKTFRKGQIEESLKSKKILWLGNVRESSKLNDFKNKFGGQVKIFAKVSGGFRLFYHNLSAKKIVEEWLQK